MGMAFKGSCEKKEYTILDAISKTTRRKVMDKDRLIGYLFVFIIILIGSYFLFRGECCARPPAFPREKANEAAQLGALTVEECIEKIEFHRGEANRIYEEVKDRVWYMPNLDDREKAKRVFSMIGPAVLVEGGVKKKSAAMFIQLALEYGLDCMDEWDYISNKWHWVEYHTDQAEFFELYLIHHARMLMDFN